MKLREAIATPCKLYPSYYRSEHFRHTEYIRYDGYTFLAMFQDEIQGVIFNSYALVVTSPIGIQQWSTFETIEELELSLLFSHLVSIDEGWEPHQCEPKDSIPEETPEERELSFLLADLIPNDEDWEFQGDSWEPQGLLGTEGEVDQFGTE